MSATDTVSRVLDWVIEGARPPVRGPFGSSDLAGCDALAAPPPALVARADVLCRRTCAALGWRTPPLGVDTPFSVDVLLMALAIGASAPPEIAQVLLRGVRPAFDAPPAELAIRHGFVTHAAPSAPQLAAQLRSLSTLTLLFDHGTEADDAGASRVAQLLRRHADGRRSLINAFARPTLSTDVRRWRTKLLERWWRVGDEDERSLVLEIYEAMLVFHESETLDQISRAMTTLASSSVQSELDDALSVGLWWRPLALVLRNYPDRLRGVRHLRTTYRRGIDLCRVASRLLGEPL